MHLRISRESCFHFQPVLEFRDVFCDDACKLRAFRSWSHQAHVTFDNVQQLWKLVHTGCTQETSNRKNPRIFFSGFYRTAFLLRIYDHRPEFINAEHLSVQSQALLCVEHRALISIPDQKCNDQKKRTGNKKNQTCND